MINYKLFTFIGLTLFLISCGDKNDAKKIFSIDTSVLKQAYNPSESIDLSLKNSENKTIDSVVYYLNNKNIGKSIQNQKLNYSLENQKLGFAKIKALIFYEGNTTETETNFTLYATEAPQLINYKIINIYPHNPNSYTQGYEFYNGILLEGSGQYGKSTLRKTNFKTGEDYKKIDLKSTTFGEGITVLNDKIYQLTYKENEAYVYDAATLKKEKTLKYFKNMQGWGLTNDGTNLYMSDGTEKIYILNPTTFEMIDYINVYTNANKIESINELEWIDGKIWANIYEKDRIIKINPKTGAIENIINFVDLKSKVTKPLQQDEVLNGIAYNSATKTILVTGKNWDKSFEISIENK
ncbi:glutaminyl-peptide cyclotransferase [uncultured Flavobacterium sp.]|mgnify:CR=1 FL=1|uniref:glutaminyl-peptide cyclotransferase n=1 Tax=uncultured Flavobacterium sp. TaxID=165435 RepID=UPI0030CA4A9B